ncbi:uncharacterized protein LOC120333708 isoform X2 [Styela clava]
MDETVVNIIGLPLTCNPVKIKVRFQSECDVSIVSVKVDQSKSEIILNSKEDAEKFCKNLPKSIKFGDTVHNLALYEDETASDSVDSSTTTEQELSPTPVAQKEDENLTIQNVQYWDTMVPLPICKYGLLVQFKDETITTKNVHDYFSSNQFSCGGPITRMQCMIDGILILFQDDKTAEKVWKFRPHRIANRPIKIFLKTIPTVYHDKLLYRPQKQNMSDQEIKTLLVGISPKQASPTTVKRYDSNNILISYEADVGHDEFQKIMLEFKKRLNENISQLPKTDCLRVKGFPSDISDEEIIILFENKQRTGGGPVTKIQHLDIDVVLVYFASYEDAMGVINKFKGKTLPVFDTLLKISKYFHFMYDKNNDDIAEDSGSTSDYSITSTLLEGKFRWLVDCKMTDKIRTQYKVKIVFNERDKTITYIGDKDEVAKVQKAVTKMLKNVTRKVLDYVEKDFVTFLLGAKSNPIICKFVFEKLQQQNINAILLVEGDIPFLWGYKNDCESALNEISRRILSVRNVPVPPNVHETESWKTITDLISKGHISVASHVTHVRIVGFHDSIAHAQELLKESLIDEDSEDFIDLKYETGIMKYLLQYCDFNSYCQKNSVEIVKADDNVIRLKGDPKVLKMIKATIKTTIAKVVRKEKQIKKFGIVDFVQSAEGKAIIEETSKAKKTVILCNRCIQPPQNVNMSSDVASVSSQVKSSTNIGGIKIRVKQGDITEEDSDAIVICAGVTFNIPGKMAEAVFDKGGGKIQQELKSSISETLRVTSSGNLHCKRIFHIKTPIIESNISLSLWSALQEAEKQRCGLISVPALGIGIIQTEKIASLMMETFYAFAKDPKTQHVKFINLVVFDQSHLYSFEKALGEIEAKDFPQGAAGVSNGTAAKMPDFVPKYPAQGEKSVSVMLGCLTVSIRKGDITEEKNDAIVNSTGSDFDLSKGLVSTAIIRKGGKRIQEEVRRIRGSDIRATSGGKLPCKKIIHVYTPTTRELFASIIGDVLEIADSEKCTSISFPAMGTGNLNRSGNDIAHTMIKAFSKFSKKNPQTTNLKVVDIVIYDQLQLPFFEKALMEQQESEAKQGNKSDKSWLQTATSFIGEKASSVSSLFSKAILYDEPLQKNVIDQNCIELQFYSSSKDKIEQAVQDIRQKIDKCYLNTPIVDDQLKYLDQNANRDLDAIERRNRVLLSRSDYKISVEGLNSNVLNAVEDIKRLLKKSQPRSFVRPNLSIYTWQYRKSDGEWESFESKIQQELAELYQNGFTTDNLLNLGITVVMLVLQMYRQTRKHFSS